MFQQNSYITKFLYHKCFASLVDQSAAGAASAIGRQRNSYDPQGGGEEQLRQRKFPEIPPPWGAVVPAMQHAARQHKQAIAGVEKPVNLSANNKRVKVAKDDYLLKNTRRRNACVFCVCYAAAAELFISNFHDQLSVTSFYKLTSIHALYSF